MQETTIKEYIEKHGEQIKVEPEQKISNNRRFNDYDEVPSIKNWSGVFIDKYYYELWINEKIHFYLPYLTPDSIRSRLLEIFKDNEELIFELFNIPPETMNRILNWWVILPPENRGWLTLAYTYTQFSGITITEYKSG